MKDNTGLVERLLNQAANFEAWSKDNDGEIIDVLKEAAAAALQSSEARALTAEGETLRLREGLKRIVDESVFNQQRFAEDTDADYFLRCFRAVKDYARSLLSSPLVVGGGNQGLSPSSANVALSLRGDSTETEGH